MPAITFLSDFGTRETSVSTVHAFFSLRFPDTTFIDVSHGVTAGDIRQAGWILLSAYRNFPKGTVHLVMIDLFNFSDTNLLLAEKDGHYFLAPDNGILSLAFGGVMGKTWLCKSFNETFGLQDWLKALGDVMKILHSGEDPGGIYTTADISTRQAQQPPRVMRNRVDCHILYIDRYGNLALNITEQQFGELVGDNAFCIRIPGEKEIKGAARNYETNVISKHYNDVDEDGFLCRFNSLGYLEVGINHRSAASKLESESFISRNLINQTITIQITGV